MPSAIRPQEAPLVSLLTLYIIDQEAMYIEYNARLKILTDWLLTTEELTYLNKPHFFGGPDVCSGCGAIYGTVPLGNVRYRCPVCIPLNKKFQDRLLRQWWITLAAKILHDMTEEMVEYYLSKAIENVALRRQESWTI